MALDLKIPKISTKPDDLLTILLRLGAFLCFAGWAWGHLYWEGPYGILFWHDATYAFADRLGIGWNEFVGSGSDDGFVQQWIGRIGWLYLACAIVSLTVRKQSRVQMGVLVGGSGLLTLVSFSKYLSSQGQLPMFVEHGGQMLIPILLILALALGPRHRVTVATAIVAVIMTFAGHGCYAVGLWPTPANFFGMTSLVLQADYETTRVFLLAVGALDFLLCIALFFPSLRIWAALYAAVWGALTALARPVAGMSMELNYWGADQFVHEAVLRAPHFLIPCYLFVLWRHERFTETDGCGVQSTQTEVKSSFARVFRQA